MKHEVTVEISTKDRYHTTLPLTLLSIAQQTYKPKMVFIYDDGEQKDLRQDSVYSHLFALLLSHGIQYEVIFGPRKGQIFNHQDAIQKAQTPWIWRVDDDDTPEPDALEHLVSNIEDGVGAISGLVLTPGDLKPLSKWASGKIEHVTTRPNVQWFVSDNKIEVDHFNNTFLYRKEAAQKSGGYCLELSPVGHREETLFTYGIKRAGYRLVMDPKAVIWHLRSPSGGIRSYHQEFFYLHDEKVFQRKLAEYGIYLKPTKFIVLNCGLGDHFAFKMMLPDLRARYADHDIVMAVCFPEVFEGEEGLQLISIADGMMIDPNQDKYNVYIWMDQNNWKGKLVDAYRKFLL